MATYVIGDVHGCYRTLMRLLETIGWDRESDRLIFTGDLVNGPDSLKVLRWARETGVETVLGNHDIHFLAVLGGVRAVRKKDSFYDLLSAPDRDELADWLRSRPFLIRLDGAAVVHAGLLPEWTMDAAERIAFEVERVVRESVPGSLFGDKPDAWSDDLPERDRIRVAVNAMTRMRVLTPEGRLDMKARGPLRSMSPDRVPWFAAPNRATADVEIFVGHWAALGFYQGDGVVALDSGCVWGNKLTAFRRDDRAVFQEESERADSRG